MTSIKRTWGAKRVIKQEICKNYQPILIDFCELEDSMWVIDDQLTDKS